LAIPRLHVDLAPTPAGLAADNHSLNLPPSARTVVWWAYGATPGSRSGTVLLGGHISWAGRPGVLGRIGSLRRGDRVTLTRQDGTSVRYAVVARRTVAKASLADLGLFRTSGAPRLVLVTCGGRYDAARHSYADNVVVQATPV
jgi:sortase (surface protein transpeptidase)